MPDLLPALLSAAYTREARHLTHQGQDCTCAAIIAALFACSCWLTLAPLLP